MLTKYLIVFFLFLSIYSNAQNRKDDSLKIIALKEEVKVLDGKITSINTDVSTKIDNQNSVLQTSFSGVSNQISSAGNFLFIVSIIIAILVVGLGIYITFIEKKVSRILKANKKIKKEIEDLNEMIQNDITSLYLKLETEETKSLIKRLVNVPEDIGNIASLLLARHISNDEYGNVKKAYLKYKAKYAPNPYHEGRLGTFQILLFQHFAGLAYSDIEIGKDIENKLDYILSAAFENDIIQSSSAIIKEYMNKKLDAEKINIFLLAISRSEFKDLQGVYNAIFDTLIVKNKQFEFYETIDNKPELLTAKIKYGEILKDMYKTNDTNTKEQMDILKNIDEKIAAQEK